MNVVTGKIFGIGLSKTGTTSLARALEILNYKTNDYPGIDSYRAGDLSSIDLSDVDAHDALTDTPIPSFYRELDTCYPGSKFILTVRDKEGWLRSCKKQFSQQSAEKRNDAHNQLIRDLYDCETYDKEKFSKGYEAFVKGVLEYFKNRPQDLLVLDVAGGEGWDKLCPFLGHAIPKIPFPKANVTNISWIKTEEIVTVAKRAGVMLFGIHEQRRSRHIILKILYAMRGGKAGELRRASRRANQIIVSGLKELNSEIPILSPESSEFVYSKRTKWNHFWLVDPLDGKDGLLRNGILFTVNIALIQDGKPLYGVVYSPLSESVYYARKGMGAFKVKGSAEPRCLIGESNEILDIEPSDTEIKEGEFSGSRALKICMVAEGIQDSFPCEKPCHDWEIAAALCVAVNAGKRIYDWNTQSQVSYNVSELVHRRFTIK